MQRLKTNANHLQIVRHDRTMEQIVFPVPNICEFLTRESKYRVFNTTERDEQGSKVNDFFQQTEDLYNEMKWQKKIRSEWEMQRPRPVYLHHGLRIACQFSVSATAVDWRA